MKNYRFEITKNYRFEITPRAAATLDEGVTFTVFIPGVTRRQAWARLKRYFPDFILLTK